MLQEGAAESGDWREFAIAEIADVVGGSTPSTKQPGNFGGDIPWLTPKDLSGPHDRYIERGKRSLSQTGLDASSAKLLPAGSVLLSTRAPIGYVALAKNPIATNQGFRNLVLREGFLSEYLYYWLVGNTNELERHASGSTFRELSGSALKAIRLRLPSLPEQRAIAHVLGTLDDKIELNRRMNETLEEMARALFKSWFVDFEPVRAKLEGRWRRGESLPGLPVEYYDLFPDRLTPSELGEIPEGWEVKALGEICEQPQYGYTASAQSDPIGPKFLRITDINKTPWIEWTKVPYCIASDRDVDRFRMRNGDVLIARMADPGHGIMVEEDLEAVFASYLIRFRPRNADHSRLLQYWLRSSNYWELVRSRGAGTTRLTLNAKVLSEFALVIPTDPVVKCFANTVRSFRRRVVSQLATTARLAALRDALLPRLVSGEVRLGLDEAG